MTRRPHGLLDAVSYVYGITARMPSLSGGTVPLADRLEALRGHSRASLPVRRGGPSGLPEDIARSVPRGTNVHTRACFVVRPSRWTPPMHLVTTVFAATPPSVGALLPSSWQRRQRRTRDRRSAGGLGWHVLFATVDNKVGQLGLL